MAADPNANSGPAPVKPQPGEEFFRRSIADLSRRLGERAGRPSEGDAQASAEARRRAMQAYELGRARRLRLMLGGAGAVVATACIAGFIVILGQPEAAPAVSRPVATVEPAAPVAMASVVPTPKPPPVEAPPPATPVVETQPPAAPAQAPAAHRRQLRNSLLRRRANRRLKPCRRRPPRPPRPRRPHSAVAKSAKCRSGCWASASIRGRSMAPRECGPKSRRSIIWRHAASRRCRRPTASCSSSCARIRRRRWSNPRSSRAPPGLPHRLRRRRPAVRSIRSSR